MTHGQEHVGSERRLRPAGDVDGLADLDWTTFHDLLFREYAVREKRARRWPSWGVKLGVSGWTLALALFILMYNNAATWDPRELTIAEMALAGTLLVGGLAPLLLSTRAADSTRNDWTIRVLEAAFPEDACDVRSKFLTAPEDERLYENSARLAARLRKKGIALAAVEH